MTGTPTSLALRLHATGDPADIRLDTLPHQPPAEGEISLRMLFAPVNPADLNILEGTYGVKPQLPAFLGNEGVAEVVAAGHGVEGFGPGTLVLPPPGCGTWRSHLTAAAADCTALPGSADPRQASMLTVNPPTAWRMLHDFVPLEPGQWIVQNAANSAVGRSVIQIARALGWKTLNLVRRPELVDELLAVGADVVWVEGDDIKKTIGKATGGAPVRLALNAVGGESASLLCRALAPGGVMVTYGAMSRQPLKIANSALIFQDIQFHGFWMTRWYRAASAGQRRAMFAELVGLMEQDRLILPVEKEFRLDEHAAALTAARAEKRPGKILFRCDHPGIASI